jgi:hypothetical protein
MCSEINRRIYDPEAASFQDKLPVPWREGKLVQAIRDAAQLVATHVNYGSFQKYHMSFVTDSMDLITALVASPPGISACSGDQFFMLSDNGRMKLRRACDFVEEVELVKAPRDKTISVRLYLQVCFPRNPELYQKWLQGESLPTKEWMFSQTTMDKFYYPLVMIENMQGPVSFFDVPLPLNFFSHEAFSIEVRGLGYTLHRHLRVKSSVVHSETFDKIYRLTCPSYSQATMFLSHT